MRWFTLALLVLTAPPLLAQRNEPRIVPRTIVVPRPDTITVEQHSSGGIMVRWTAVPGAKGYFLGRAEGNYGWRRVPFPIAGPNSNSYLDRQARPNMRYRYQVSTVDSADRTSLRVTSDSITARLRGPSASPGNVVASVTGEGQVTVTWRSVDGANRYRVTRERDGGQQVLISQNTGLTRLVDRVGATAADQVLSYQVVAVQPDGWWGPAARSNSVTIPPASPSTSDPDPPDTDAPGTGTATSPVAPASVLVTVAPGTAIRVGASASLTAGSGAQWLSLDPGIASVSPAGLITGRAAGDTRIVAVSRGAGGMVNVSVVGVSVTP